MGTPRSTNRQAYGCRRGRLLRSYPVQPAYERRGYAYPVPRREPYRWGGLPFNLAHGFVESSIDYLCQLELALFLDATRENPTITR